MEVRSLRESSASPRSVRTKRGAGVQIRETRPAPTRGIITWESRAAEKPSNRRRWSGLIQGQSERMSNMRFSVGLSAAGSR